jgi:hypothetical protein
MTASRLTKKEMKDVVAKRVRRRNVSVLRLVGIDTRKLSAAEITQGGELARRITACCGWGADSRRGKACADWQTFVRRAVLRGTDITPDREQARHAATLDRIKAKLDRVNVSRTGRQVNITKPLDAEPEASIRPPRNEYRMSKRESWRDQIAIHPAAELFPLMTEAELAARSVTLIVNSSDRPRPRRAGTCHDRPVFGTGTKRVDVVWRSGPWI